MQKHSFLALILGLSISGAYAQKAAQCQVKGNIEGLGNRKVVFFYNCQGRQQRDTVQAHNNQFTYTARPTDDGQFNLKLVPGKFSSVWLEPGTVTITGSFSAPTAISITGTPENALTTRYEQQVNRPLEQRAAAHPDSVAALRVLHGQATRAFIAAHPAARTSADLLYQEAKYNNDRPVADYQSLFNKLTPAVQASAQGQNVARRLTILRKQPQVGQVLPSFTIPDTAGVAVSLSSFRGRYVLLDFWGHWCAPCIKSMPHLKQLQAQYATQLAVVGIGMEAADDKPLWLKAIRKHQLTWTQLSELKSDKGVIEALNVEGFPTYMLLDPQGRLLAKSFELDAIDAELKRRLKTP
ncbi:TlpA disulfide reductase family protein [Hymenobacter pini]|uniref:TlpA disulfide reductase family protein n=1 Tax=Hymenobacter pini TaxID=2880879 RepID=UPI001CF4B7ED|nr:TlpA disulfide reductase family protein [Hymenobacter pini]MCA8830376.1 AhpC/TSA family protein [Hymenobacter pini]